MSALHFGDLLTMLNVNKCMIEDKYSAAAVFRKDFLAAASWRCTSVSQVLGVVARIIADPIQQFCHH